MKKISREDLIRAFREAESSDYNKFFSGLIVKADGSERWINCRLGVEKYKKGGQLTYDPISRGLLVVFEPQEVDKVAAGESKSVYKSINLKTIKEVKGFPEAGEHFIVEG